MVAVLEHKFFLSEIIGRKVYLKTEQIGRLDDMVIVETGKLPEVSHFVVSRSVRLSVAVAAVGQIDPDFEYRDRVRRERSRRVRARAAEGSILLHGTSSTRRSSTWTITKSRSSTTSAWNFQAGKLYVSEVDFSRRRLLRRMGLKKLANWISEQREETTVSWMYVQPLPEHIGIFKGHVKLNVLKENISDIHPVDLADILEELEGDQRLAVFNELEPEHASDTLEEVEPRVQRELIHAIEKRRAAQLINAMSPAQAADILAALPTAEADELLQLIDKDSAAKVQTIIDQHDENILLFSTQQFMKMPESTRVEDVMIRLSRNRARHGRDHVRLCHRRAGRSQRSGRFRELIDGRARPVDSAKS